MRVRRNHGVRGSAGYLRRLGRLESCGDDPRTGEKEGQTENIRFADKVDEGSHVGAINVDSSSTRLLEGCLLLAQYAPWINDYAMPALRPVAHEFTHVNERSRCRMILRLGVGCSKVSWFGRGLCRILRPCRERPHRSRAAEQRDELAASHSITSSARASSDGGTSRLSALAVDRLMTNSNLVGGMTGKSIGLAPLSIRPA